jgi:protein O-mannosyl-transferase
VGKSFTGKGPASGSRRRVRQAEHPTGSRWFRRAPLCSLLLVVAAVAAYGNSFRGAFIFDDRDTILLDKHLGTFDSFAAVLLGVQSGPTGGRPLASLSFHLNALAAGRTPAGYHLVNLVIHVLAGLVLFGCLRRIVSARGGRDGEDGLAVAFAVSLLWLLHPLQTEAVTYVSQRAESLMGLFFLLAVYAALRGFDSTRPAPWFGLAALSSLLSVLSKEVGIVASVAIFVYDGLFVSTGMRAAWKRHKGLYAGFALTWVAAGLLQLANPRGYSVSLTSAALSPLQYLERQAVGILVYLKLVVWPSPLVFDYGISPRGPSLVAVVASGVVLAGAAVASVLAARRRRLAGFAGLAFFLILAPSSSVIPVLTEVLAEHRMYLPLSCVLAVLVGGAVALARRYEGRRWLPARRGFAVIGWVLLALAAGAAGVLTWQRNAVYRSELSLWQDTTAKVPSNARAQNNLGMAWLESGRVGDALACFQEAVSLNPGYFEAHANLALALERSGRSSEALPHIRRAIELKPGNAPAQDQLVRLLASLGRWDDALAASLANVREFPERAASNSLHASVLMRMGRTDEALGYLRKAKELQHRGDTRAPASSETAPIR